MASINFPAPVRPANPMHRVCRANSGLYNGYPDLRAKQRWDVRQIVNVGFAKGLVVTARHRTPGDGHLDIWALWQPSINRFYQCQPHRRLSLVESLVEAMEE